MAPQPSERVVFQTLSTLCESLGYDYHLVLVNTHDPTDRHWAASDDLSSLELVGEFSKGSRIIPAETAASDVAISRRRVASGFDDTDESTYGGGELEPFVKTEADELPASMRDFSSFLPNTGRPIASSQNQAYASSNGKVHSRKPRSNAGGAVVKKRTRLTLEEKKNILGFIEAGNRLEKAADHFGYSLTTMNQIWRCRKKIKVTCQPGVNLKRKLIRESPYRELEIPLIEWCKRMKEEGAFINGPMVQDEALNIAERMGMKQFTASNGWLARFLDRNDLRLKAVDVARVEPLETEEEEGAESVANQISNSP